MWRLNALAKAMLPRKLKLVGSAAEMNGLSSDEVRAGLGTLRDVKLMVGVRGMRK